MDVEKLRQVRAELLAEVEGLEAKVAPLEQLLNKRRTQLDALEDLIRMEESAEPQRLASAPRAVNTVADAAYEILSRANTATHYSQLLEDIVATGVAVPGRDKGTNLIAHLSRDDRFARVGSGTYALTEWGMKAMPKRRRAKKARRR